MKRDYKSTWKAPCRPAGSCGGPRLYGLNPTGLPADFNLAIHGDRPMVTIRPPLTDEHTDIVSITVAYIFPGFSVSDDDHELNHKMMPYKEVGISGTGFLSDLKMPLLPSFGRYVQIPCGYNLAEMTFEAGDPIIFRGGQWLVTPTLEDARDGNPGGHAYDNEDRFYPSDERMVAVSGPYHVNGYTALCLHVRPLQYNPGLVELRGYGNVQVTVRIAPARGSAGVPNICDVLPDVAAFDLRAFGNLFLNPARRLFASSETVPCGSLEDAEYLIIYSTAFQEPAERLSKWKNRIGLITRTISAATVFVAEDTADRKVARLKAFIRGLRSKPGSSLRYVLLFGDADTIPTDSSTDQYYYTEKDKSDATCCLAWVCGGRIPVRSYAEASMAVDNIIRYEKEPPDEPGYYRRMTFAAYFEDGKRRPDNKADNDYIRVMERIRRHLLSYGFDIARVYVAQKETNVMEAKYRDGTSLPGDVKDAIVDPETARRLLITRMNEGQLIIGHRDHGLKQGWQHPSFTIDDLSAVSAMWASVFFSINCESGRFVLRDSASGSEKDCFAEAVLTSKGGAPCLIAATKYSWLWRNDSIVKALFDAIWPGILPTYAEAGPARPIRYGRLGDILNYAKAYLVVAHGENKNTIETIEMYHLIGDPSLQIWKQEPTIIELTARQEDEILHIRMDSCPEDARITIWVGDNLIGRVEPVDTTIRFPLPSPGPIWAGSYTLTVCFFAPDHRYIEMEVDVPIPD